MQCTTSVIPLLDTAGGSLLLRFFGDRKVLSNEERLQLKDMGCDSDEDLLST